MARFGALLHALATLLAGVLVTGTAGAQVVNGGFETGNLSGWTVSGFLNNAGGPTTGGPQYSTFLAAQAAGSPTATSNVAEASQTSTFDGLGTAGPAVLPTSGNFLAFVSNEAAGGDDTLTGSSISQTFTVPSGATTLTMNVMLLNNDDPVDFAGFDDFGGVALTQGATVLAQYNLDLDPASTANQHVTAGSNRGGFLNSTAFVPVTFDVSGLVGQSVTLTAYSVHYGGDNSVESRLLIDGVTVNAGGVVPPSSVQAIPTLSTTLLAALCLLLLGVAMGNLRRRRPRG